MANIRTDLIQDAERRLTGAAAQQLINTIRFVDRRANNPREEQLDARRKQLQSQFPNASRADAVFERILDGNDLTPVSYLEMGVRAARAVCRIQIPFSDGTRLFGTGFLIAPGVLLTNHHVLPDERQATQATVEFNYELDSHGNEKPAARYSLRPATLFHANPQLDFAVVAVDSVAQAGGVRLDQFGWLPLLGEPGKAIVGEFLSIIQHPSGERKQVCVRENKLLKYGDQTLWYQADTVAGSSGSPVFNPFWQVVALHHAGIPKKNAKGQILTVRGTVATATTDEKEVQWIANEGIRASQIVNYLRENLATDPLIQRVLAAAPPPEHESDCAPFTSNPYSTPHRSTASGRVNGGELFAEIHPDGAALVVPIRIPLPMIQRDGTTAFDLRGTTSGTEWRPAVNPGPDPSTTDTRAKAGPPKVESFESTRVDDTETPPGLNERSGYNCHFLGNGHLTVEFPTISDAFASQIAHRRDAGHAGETELTYENFSVVVNSVRKLPFFVAANLNEIPAGDAGDVSSATWRLDPRIDEQDQPGDRLGEQSGRSSRDARSEVLFQPLTKVGLEVGVSDTTFITHLVPVAARLDEPGSLWNGIEQHILSQLDSKDRRLCVICGPVFDGPEVKANARVDLFKRGETDPNISGIAVPKLLWKLVAAPREGRLLVTAFVFAVSDLVRNSRSVPAESKPLLYQVSLDVVAHLTKLRFGELFIAHGQVEEEVGKIIPIKRMTDVRLLGFST